MHIFRDSDTPAQPADPNSFAGSVVTKLLASSTEQTPVRVYRVAFQPGGHTNWHRHSGPQWLLVIEGRIQIQKWGEPIQEVGAGDAIVIGKGEKHWHGAPPDGHGVHLAVNVNMETEWLEPLTDAQYRG